MYQEFLSNKNCVLLKKFLIFLFFTVEPVFKMYALLWYVFHLK